MDARLLRLSLRLSQSALAARARTSQTSISAFERRSRRISVELAQRILAVLVAQGLNSPGIPIAPSSTAPDRQRVDH